MSENRTRTGQFAKGKSGNPSGRPRQAPDIKGLIQQNTVKAVKTIIDIMNDDDAPGKVRLAAAIAILDRALGKPETTSKVELSGRGEVKEYVCRWMTEDDVKKENVKKEGAVA